MISIVQLWKPILLSTVLVFIISSLIHMVVKWHNSDYRRLPNEDEVRDAIRRGQPEPGQYVMPHCMDMKEMGNPDFQKKFEEGPLGLLYLKANGMPSMGGSLGGWFAFNLVISFSLAYLLSRTLAPATPCLQIFRVASSICFLVHAGGAVPAAIWMGKPWRVVIKEAVDGLAYALVTGATFAWLWVR